MSPLPETKCPTCKKKGPWLALDTAPFCSERCKLIDLGAWLKEEHIIASPLRPDMFDEYEELDPGIDPDKPEESK
jgi:endogenous inhibitor of DNA gyrase (YacG/DUF329 family)